MSVYGSINEANSIQYMYNLICMESTNFLFEDIEIVSEKIDMSKVKENLRTAVKNIIQKIKDFCNWIKDKVMGFFDKAKSNVHGKESLKSKYERIKNKIKSEKANNESAIVTEATDLEEFDKYKLPMSKDFDPVSVIEYMKAFYEVKFGKVFNELGWEGYKEKLSSFEKYCEFIKVDPNLMATSDEKKCTVEQFIMDNWQFHFERLLSNKQSLSNFIDDLKTDIREIDKALNDLEEESKEIKDKANGPDGWLYRDKMNKYYDTKRRLEEQMYTTQRKLALNSQALRNVAEYVKACDSAVASISAKLDNFDKK